MDRDELIRRLAAFEWNDIEFKEAQREVPKDAYETVSAFSNTAGGYLVFGIREKSGHYEVVGVLEADKVQGDFLTTLRSAQKVNRVVAVKEDKIEHEAQTLLVFHIPEANRKDKPVFLDGNVMRSFIRKGGCDVKCSPEELKRFLVDAAGERHDGEILDLDPEHFFDADTLAWYRGVFAQRNPTSDPTLSHLEFLHHWGLVVEQDANPRPTRAAALLFGSDAVLRQVLPRPVVDCQRVDANRSDALPEQRWTDRVVVELNLIRAWQAVMDWYLKHAERPFTVDPATLQRADAPPDFVAFREAAINLLIHQDYSDHSRTPVIQFFRDCALFGNPGDAFATTEELLEPGEKEVRNPRIVGAFRRIGLSEQAGTGVRAIYRSWQQLGHLPPAIENDKARKSFRLNLPKELLLSPEQVLFQAGLGVHLTDEEAKVFAFACRLGRIRAQDVRLLVGASLGDARGILDRLRVQALLAPEAPDSPYLVISEHLRGRFEQPARGPADADLVTDQAPREAERLVTDQPREPEPGLVNEAPRAPRTLTPTQWKILALCAAPRTLADLMSHFDVTHRTFFRRSHIDPLIAATVLRMLHPEQPNHPNQAYILTKVGAKLLAIKEAQDGQEDTRA